MLALCLLVTAAFPPGAPAAPPSRGRDAGPAVARIEREIVERVNQIRMERGLRPLAVDVELTAVARAHSCRMARHGVFAHETRVDGTAADRVREAGWEFRSVGENLARNARVPDPAAAAVQGWMQSAGHRGNILRAAFTHTGVGVCAGDRGHYITQVFVEPPANPEPAR